MKYYRTSADSFYKNDNNKWYWWCRCKDKNWDFGWESLDLEENLLLRQRIEELPHSTGEKVSKLQILLVCGPEAVRDEG